MASQNPEDRIVTRARIVAAFRRGTNRTAPSREDKYLKYLAEKIGVPVELADIAKVVKHKDKMVQRKNQSAWAGAIEDDLEPCIEGTVLAFDAGLKKSRRRGLFRRSTQQPETTGYCVDALRFPFYLKFNFPSNREETNTLGRLRFQWIDVTGCQRCPIGTEGFCSNRERVFTPILPPNIQERLEKLESELKLNQNIIKVLKIDSQRETRNIPMQFIDIEMCRSTYSRFKMTNYAIEDLPPKYKENVSADKSPLGNQLGITIWLVQTDAKGNPLKTMLSWRKPKQSPGVLQIGWGQYHAAASSQIKLFTEGPIKHQHHSLEDSVWALPSLEKAVNFELENETALDPAKVERKELLGFGWLLNLRHPEVLVLVETQVELNSLPNTEEDMNSGLLLHSDEFRMKKIVPFAKENLREFARYLVGLYPHAYKAVPETSNKSSRGRPSVQRNSFVEWSPQGAVTGILVAERYFGRETLQQAVADVIENDLAKELPFWNQIR